MELDVLSSWNQDVVSISILALPLIASLALIVVRSASTLPYSPNGGTIDETS